MSDPAEIERLLALIRAGDENARNELIKIACDQMRLMIRRMLSCFPTVRRWEQTDDVVQNVLLRFHRALMQTTPESPRHFYNLMTTLARRELIDLARRHSGIEGHAANHFTDGSGKAADDAGGPLTNQRDQNAEPGDLESWTWFHEAVKALPDEEREVFDLLWYAGLAQDQAAVAIGVSLRTVKRRWQSARIKLNNVLADRKERQT